jgi:hypothetical protein
MDLCKSKINHLVDGLNYVQSYWENILNVTKNTHEDHLSKFDTVSL